MLDRFSYLYFVIAKCHHRHNITKPIIIIIITLCPALERDVTLLAIGANLAKIARAAVRKSRAAALSLIQLLAQSQLQRPAMRHLRWWLLVRRLFSPINTAEGVRPKHAEAVSKWFLDLFSFILLKLKIIKSDSVGGKEGEKVDGSKREMCIVCIALLGMA